MVAVKLNEEHLGSQIEKGLILQFLDRMRSVDLQSTLPDTSNLSEQLNCFDVNLFYDVTHKFLYLMKTYLPDFDLIDFKRYLINTPIGIGGFYGQPSGGYDYLHHYGFCTPLNSHIIRSTYLCTLELCRNYLHDSCHANTFKSYRWDNSKNEAYRYQYGINFRNSAGISYSDKELSKKVPLGINLNVLMDGSIQLFVSGFISKYFKELKVFSSREQNIYDELVGKRFDLSEFHQAQEFYDDVLTPTRVFLKYWNREFLLNEVLEAMFSGNIQRLRDYFDSKLGISDAWETMFRRSDFTE